MQLQWKLRMSKRTFVIAVPFVSVLVLSLPTMSREVEEERIIGRGAAHKPLHRCNLDSSIIDASESDYAQKKNARTILAVVGCIRGFVVSSVRITISSSL